LIAAVVFAGSMVVRVIAIFWKKPSSPAGFRPKRESWEARYRAAMSSPRDGVSRPSSSSEARNVR
jgi:hypothetical protein